MTSADRPASTCVLMGSESLLIQCGEIWLEKGHRIRAVVSAERPILDWAASRGVPVEPPGKDLGARLRAIDHDWFFSITNLAMVPEEVLGLPRRGAINFHDGPLPRYAGMYTPAWALIEGAREYGVSFHAMTRGADEGDLYVQRFFEIGPDDTSLTLNTRCYEAAIEAFGELVDQLANGTASPRAQDLGQRTYFPRHARPAAAAVIDWTKPAAEIARLVRALDFGQYENAFASARLLHAGQLHLVRAVRLDDAGEGAFASARPGEIVACDESGLRVACGDGDALLLTDCSCPRGVPVPALELMRRLSLAVGDRFELHDAATRARLEAQGERATRSESFWVPRLARRESPELPFRGVEPDVATGHSAGDSASNSVGNPSGNTAGNPIGNAPAPGRLELARPQGFTGDAATWVAAFAAFVARVGGRARFDLGYADDVLAGSIAGLEALFTPRVPLRIDVDLAGGAREVEAKLRGELERVREKGFAWADAVARYPRLAGQADLIAGRLASVAVDVVADPGARGLPGGAELLLAVTPAGDRACWLFDPRVFGTARMRALADSFRVFAEGFARPDARLRKLPLLAEAERAKVLRTWNETSVPVPGDACIHTLFAAQAAQRPDARALTFEGRGRSFAELECEANRLAHHLVALGIGPDRLVGVHLERSIEMVVAILAVLKAGGAYVPLDPTYPEDRIAYMIEDSKAALVLTTSALAARLRAGGTRTVTIAGDAAEIARRSDTPPATAVRPTHLAYVIYTSGSTGKPKGVMVEHRNVVNFFAGMDARIPHDPPGVWLAVTSLSFDISVLELLWTLTRGFEVVVYADRQRKLAGGTAAAPDWRPIDFGLALWGSDAGPGPRKYELMLEAAKFGDLHGFRSVMTPERHFGAFGGPFPNPSVTGAAIAAVTKRIQIRAGSCVLPLHHPVRVAEEWAVVDNLSGGRVGISFASGWQPNDFVIRPEGFANAKTQMFEGARAVQRLWRGEAVEFRNPKGDLVPTATLPRPVQPELPSWMTTAGNVETFRAAGAGGFNVLTHLLGQTLEELAEKVAVYRQARADAGLDPATGVVTCMLHTFVGDDVDAVRETVRQPMKDYLASAMALVVGFAWSFPAFDRPGGPDSKPEDVDLASLTEDETDAILEFAFERYFETSGLFGTPEICARMIDRCKAADIDEIASLIDFGVPTDVVLASLPMLDRVRREANAPPAGWVAPSVAQTASSEASVEGDHSLAAQIDARRVTHMQCTPSHARMLLTDPDTRGALARVSHWMIGGEAFPVSLAGELDAAGVRDVQNMYGPTETTIWSSTEAVAARAESISIGRPIANTRFYILGDGDEPLPVGVPGELLIGGEGVVRGYLGRPELTAERFIPDPFDSTPGARLYRTGDLAKWRADGTIDFLGRLDHQVKIRGYRIELGEIETRLAALAGIREAVVIAREDTPGDVRLVAYLIGAAGPVPDATLKDALAADLPDFMLPSTYVFLERYPQTPNGKIDRKALPAPTEVRAAAATAEYKPPSSELEQTIADVWREVLYLEQVGVDDNFFDLGGHSLLVVQAHRKLRDQTTTPLSLTDLYRFPTLRGLAAHLSADGGGDEGVERSQARGEKRREALSRRRRGRERA